MKTGLVRFEETLGYLSIQSKNLFTPPETLSIRNLIVIAIGALVGIGSISYLSIGMGAPMLIASFGASAVLLYGVPDSPLAKYKNVFFGHLFSAIVGTAVSMILGYTWYAVAIAVAVAIILMTVTGTVHPPGGATALVCVTSNVTPSFILAPVMAGVFILIVVAYFVNKLRVDRVEK